MFHQYVENSISIMLNIMITRVVFSETQWLEDIQCRKTPQLAGYREPLFSKVSLGTTADGVQACLEACACEARRRGKCLISVHHK